MNQHIAVFCGASSGQNPLYVEEAQKLGRILVENNYGLIYGGASIGIMGAIADEVLKNKGHVIGVIPEKLCVKEVVHQGCSELKIVKTMHERKEIMYRLSTAFFIMPGGMGTLDEFFEILTWKQLGYHQKNIVLININGYFDPLITWFQNATFENFVKKTDQSLFLHVNSLQDIPWDRMAEGI